MESTDPIERVLEAHQITVTIAGPWGETTHLSIAIPDLRTAPRRVWGDWGPMYVISLPPDRPVEVFARPPERPEGSRQRLDLSELEIESPMLAATRRATPLVMKLPLTHKGLLLHVFHDPRGLPARVELTPLGGASGRRSLCDVGIRRDEAAFAAVHEAHDFERASFALGGDQHAAE